MNGKEIFILEEILSLERKTQFSKFHFEILLKKTLSFEFFEKRMKFSIIMLSYYCDKSIQVM